MTKEEFLFQLQKASIGAAEFAEEFITNKVIRKFKYDVILIAPLESKGSDGFKEYPEGRSKKVFGVDMNRAADLIYQEGKAPIWIDISVSKVKRTTTILRLICSRDYSNKKEELYYLENGTEPFGIKSPFLPVDYKEGVKFKLK
jgi:hypothetical protein